MNDIEILQHAKQYIDKLANGINPLTNEKVDESDIINNIRISRCLFYVSNVLQEDIVRAQIGSSDKYEYKKKKKANYYITMEQRQKYQLNDNKVTLTDIANQLNALVDTEQCYKIHYKTLMNWLVKAGFVEEQTTDNKTVKTPTKTGLEIGISTEVRKGQNGCFQVLVYNRTAQQFIVDNIEAVLACAVDSDALEYGGKAWNKNQDDCLIDLFGKQVPVNEIAVTLCRTPTAIRARLKKLGVIDRRSDAK